MLFAAAQVLIHIHNELDKFDPELVYTTGEIKCTPCTHTVIPEFVDFSLDARHEDPKVIEQVLSVIENLPKEVAKCRVEYEKLGLVDTDF